jgi:thiamine pyrophosphokinase
LRVAIFSNGKIEHPEIDRENLNPDDLIYAADGGLHHVLAFDLLPDLVIGDLDSIDGGLVRRLKARSIEIIQHQPRKNETDLELALREAVARGASQIVILGAFGGRWDQTFANILLPTLAEFEGCEVLFLDGLQELQVVRAGSACYLQGQVGETVSLIPLEGDVHSVSTSGLEYPLDDETLVFGATRGVSNVLAATEASIKVGDGMLLCVHFRGEGSTL